MTIRLLVAALAFLLFVPIGVSAQDAKPSPWSGFAYIHLNTDTSRDGGKMEIPRARLRLTRKPQEGCAAGQVELDPSDQSWVHQAWLACHTENGWAMKIGRVFLSALTQSPPPFLLREVGYQGSYPYNAYAYGAQVEGPLGRGWKVGVDFTGKSGLDFSAPGQFRGMEVSLLVSRKKGVVGYGFAAQVGSDIASRYGLNGEWRAKRFTLSGLVSYATERKHAEGFVVAELRLTEFLQPYFQLDRSKGHTTWLLGLQFRPSGNVFLVADANRARAATRTQVFFKK